MNNDDFLEDDAPAGLSQPARPVDAPVDLPVDFEAFYLHHQEIYHDYAEVRLGDRRSAEGLVHQIFLQLLGSWEELLLEEDLEQQAWAVLRHMVTRQLRRNHRRPSFIADGSFHRALRASQDQMKVVESSIGLYSAIADLPSRQFDVVVLRHVLGYSTRRIAWFLGLDERTVDYHGRKGKERLAVQLGIPLASGQHSQERTQQ